MIRLALVPLLLVSPAASAAEGGTVRVPRTSAEARALLDRVDDMWRGESSHGRMRMKVVTENWTRTLRVEFWSQGKEKSLMRILSPKKERGMSTLKVDRDIWNYFPKIKRVMKLPSSMLGNSWMGSHYTNDDLVKESRMADDYTFTVSDTGVEKSGAPVVALTCLPKEDAAVVWGKVVLIVRLSDTMPERISYYDEDFKLARTMTFSDYRKMGGRLMPVSSRIVPADKPAEYTEVVYEEIAFDIDLDPKLFSLRSLKGRGAGRR